MFTLYTSKQRSVHELIIQAVKTNTLLGLYINAKGGNIKTIFSMGFSNMSIGLMVVDVWYLLDKGRHLH